MIECDISDLIENIIQKSSLNCHEEEVSSEAWYDLQSSVKNFLIMINNYPDINLPSCKCFARLLLIIFGVRGNYITTNKLTSKDREFLDLTDSILATLFSKYNVCEIQSFLAKSIENHKIYDLILQEATKALTNLSSGSTNISPICMGPLFRDALYCTTKDIAYPILKENQQLDILHPFCLQMLEDYRVILQECALELLDHLADQFPLSTWRLSGRASATINALCNQRTTIKTYPKVFHLLNRCIMKFIGILDQNESISAAEKFMEQILTETNLAGNLKERLVLLDTIRVCSDILKSRVAKQGKSFGTAIRNALFAPPQPFHDASLKQLERDSYILILNIMSAFVDYTIDIVFPDIIDIIVPPLCVFLELSVARPDLNSMPDFMEELTSLISTILTKISIRQPEKFHFYMRKMFVKFPSLKNVILEPTFQ